MDVDELRHACQANPEAFARIVNEDLLTLRQLAALFQANLSAASMQMWRGKGPKPLAARVGTMRVWTRWDVEAFIADNPKTIRHHEPVNRCYYCAGKRSPCTCTEDCGAREFGPESHPCPKRPNATMSEVAS